MFVNPINNDAATFIEVVQRKYQKTYKYICMKCQNTGTFTTKKKRKEFGEFYLESKIIKPKFSNAKYIRCPYCKNSYVIERYSVYFPKTFISETEDEIKIISYGCIPLITSPYKLITDEKDTEDERPLVKHLTGNIRIPRNISVTFDFLKRYLYGEHNTPVSVGYKKDRVVVTYNKRTKTIKFQRGNLVFVLNRGVNHDKVYSYMDALYEFLPDEIIGKIYNSLLPGVHKNELIRWQLPSNVPEFLNLTSNDRIMKLKKLMYLSYIPNIAMFNEKYDFYEFFVDPYSLKLFKNATNELDAFRALIPGISKKAIPLLKQTVIYYKNFSSSFLGLLDDPHLIRKLLQFLIDNELHVGINTTFFSGTNYSQKKKSYYSFRQAKKYLYHFLAPGVIDHQLNLVLSKNNITYLNNFIDMLSDTISSVRIYHERKVEIAKMLEDEPEQEHYLNLSNLIQEMEYKKRSFYSVRKLHDELTKLNQLLTLEFKNYNYSLVQEQMEETINDFTFMLPRNTEELIRLADVLEICVADYEDYIIYGDCTIIGVHHKNVPVMCLEFSEDFVLVQAKKHNNQILKNTNEDQKLIKHLKTYIEAKGYIVQTSDLDEVQLNTK